MKKKDMEDEFKHFINPVFEIGETVYLKTDTMQYPRIVLYYAVFESILRYVIAHVNEEFIVYEFEISKERDEKLFKDYNPDA